MLPKPNEGLTEKQWIQVEELANQKATEKDIAEQEEALRLFNTIKYEE